MNEARLAQGARELETPYTVVLLDAIEKANPRQLNLFLQVFDEAG